MISPQVCLSICFFARVNTLLDEHAPNHKLSKKEISLKPKPWINQNIQALMRERDRLFKHYCNKNNPTLKEAKHKKYKNARKENIIRIIFKSIQKMLKNLGRHQINCNIEI